MQFIACHFYLSKAAVKKKKDFSGGLVVETLLPMQRTQVQSVVGEQRSHMPCSTAKIH